MSMAADGLESAERSVLLRALVSQNREQAEQIEQMTAALRALALRDELTGLWSKRALMMVLEHEEKLARRRGHSILVFSVDIDGLGALNESRGRKTGDLAIADAAKALRTTFRDADLVARVGGDEFVVAAFDCSLESGQTIVDRLRHLLGLFNSRKASPYTVDVSIGLALYDPKACETIGEVVERAHLELEVNKRRRADLRAVTFDLASGF